MRRLNVFAALLTVSTTLAVLVGAVGAVPASALPVGAGAGGTWGKAEEIPGTAKLNVGGTASVNSLSCSSPGNCAVGGSYALKTGESAFLATQRSGGWRTAFKVSGSIMKSQNSQVTSVSCPSAGNCAAAGSYEDSGSRTQAFVVTERKGTWSAAREVPGSGQLNAGGGGGISNLVCVSAGNCVVAGYYTDSSRTDHVYTVSERNGTWQHVDQLNLTALGAGSYILVTSLSCPSAGSCALGGQYIDSHGRDQAFLASEKNGAWRAAEEVPGTGPLNAGGIATTSSVSCPSAGNCALDGSYLDNSGHTELFVVSESNGRWGTASEMAGLAKLNAGGSAAVGMVSCASAGYCVTGGQYLDGVHHVHAFIATERKGHWANAEQVPGLTKLKASGSSVTVISCASAGNCGIGGNYIDGSGQLQAFVANQGKGRWGNAIEVPGSAALNKGGEAMITSISCKSATACSAGGTYLDRKLDFQVMVVSEAS